MRNSDDSSPSSSFIRSIDRIDRDDRELSESIAGHFGDVCGIWEEVVKSGPVKSLISELLPRSIMLRWDWEKSRETTEEYLQYHFKYALLRDETTLASSRKVIASHLKNVPIELVTGALNHVEAVASLMPGKG